MHVEECCQALLSYLIPIVDQERQGICIDVGVGTFAFYCELFARLGFQTVAVEPMPVNALKQVCQQHNITLIEGCISDVNDIQTLHIGTYQGVENLNLCSLEADWWGASTETRQVQSITLSKLMSSVNAHQVSCLKLDVEGTEASVIRQFMALPELLLPSVVMFEYGGGNNKEQGRKGWSPKFLTATMECLSVLKQCGYGFSIIIDAAKDTAEVIFDLQLSNLDPNEIFEPRAVYGNIISFRKKIYSERAIANICTLYRNNDLVASSNAVIPNLQADNCVISLSGIVNMNNQIAISELNRLIPPEIKNDEFYAAIQKLAREENIKTVLEIGSSSGEGSTEAIVTGLRQNPNKPTLFCMEVSQTRFAELRKRYANDSFVKCYNVSSVSLQQFPDENEVKNFYQTTQTNLNHYPLDRVIGWLRQDIEYLKNSGVPDNGIKKIKQENNIGSFDLVLIDGSEFTGSADLNEVYEAKIICLDDINTFKNYRNHQKLLADQNYVLVAQNYSIRNGYSIFKRVKRIKNYLFEQEIAEQLLVSKLVRSEMGEAPKMLDLQHLCMQYSVSPRGVIHVGAHEGKEEIALYQAMGVQKVLFIEANPVVFERLKVNIAGIPNVQAVNCAISNFNGTVNLHVTSMDQSSSILAMKLCQELYPNIKETHQIPVQSRTLDTLLQELQLQPSDFNIINIDIQGAELLALQGATNVLKHIQAINTEVNYKELYEGCALVEQLDEFLDIHGFERVATTTPYHPSWGDAFYVKKPVITMSTLGTNGRFANQLFQYAFLKIYAKEHNLRVETPEWIGQYLFGHNDPPISKQLPVVQEPTSILSEARVPNTQELFKNVDFWGYFQYHTQYYAPHKENFCSLFKPVTEIEMQVAEALKRLRFRGKTLVGLHLRRGDYGYNYFFVAPSKWYKEWLRDLWETLDEPILFIASDEPEKIIGDFGEYNPVTVKDLGIELPQAEFYPDFYLLSNCDIVAISNSSFSFAACMLNEGGKLFFRPDLQAEKLIRFAPWDSEVILRDAELPNLIPNNSITKVVHQFSGLPIHFFTIVLNGEPFIRYHIEVFKQLPFKWHWHIIEGVADLEHDTAWSLRNGGHVTDEVHRNGRSNDGTTEYLDELARLYPDNITVYRKPEGVFWDGKREMVNAPLANINEECLLWQVDADELWTVEQIFTARKMFINNPDKTAAFYWCWYFVGENLVISTRNCYAQNPQQEWLRTWRYKPGAVWAAHEPPRLAEPSPNGEWRDVAAVNPFVHEETEQLGLIFQHFAYVTPEQLRFKEQYYGYTNATSQWMELQAQAQLPVLLRQYFPWVQDATQVDTASSCGVVPIAQRKGSSEVWRFLQLEELQRQPVKIEKSSPTIIVDGVFFQLYKTGIARVWRSLLEEWADNGFAKHIVVLDRAGTAPAIPGIRYRPVPPYDYGRTNADREMLQQVCDEEGADLFISSYYTTPLSTLSVFMAYDMIPEVMGWDLNDPMWREKHYAIQHASAYMAISENTARDLVKFFPQISSESVTVALCGVKRSFLPASLEEVNSFRTKYGISKPYFIVVGTGGYKNTILFFQAFAQLYSRGGFEIVCTGSGSILEAEFRSYTSGSVVHMLQLSDEELKAAYSGAVALVYPSTYEGFGLPVLEAIACGCPVITCPNASLPEVAGEAALYVNDDDIDGLTDALCEVQKPSVRNSLIAAGLEQAKKFSWSKMAKTVGSALIDATLLPLNLKDINLIVFPDWSQSEELLCFDLERVIRAIATHPDRSQITLLVDTGNISEEDAALILSSVTMNLLLQEDLDVSEGPEISLVGQLGEIQWSALLPRIHARIVLENENQGVIARVKAENIPSCELDTFSDEQAAQLKPGIWDITGLSEIVHFNRGIALHKQGKFAEAVSSYEKALEIKPDFAEARYQLCLTRYQNQIILKGYQFTQDWFSFNVPIWEQHLKHFINIPTLNVLEIGSWEGRSTCWLLDNILTHESNKITCIDTFEGSFEHKYDTTYVKSIEQLQSIEERFDFNIARTGVPEKVQKFVGKSQEVLRTLPLNSYDIVYIDGSHVASDVIQDAVLVWQLVKPGGFIIFDDYFFTFPQNTAWNTKIGIDAFMRLFSDNFRLIHKAHQVIIEKTS